MHPKCFFAPRLFAPVAASVLALLACAPDAHAQTVRTWAANPPSGNFSGNANWVQGSAPPVNDPTLELNFGASSNRTVTNDLGTLLVNIVRFTNTVNGEYFLDGGTLNFGGANNRLESDTNNSGTINNDILLTNTLTISKTVNGGGLLLNGVISGNGGLVVNANPASFYAVVLNGANTYTGGTTINSGPVDLGSNTALGTGFITINNGGTLSLNGRTIANNVTVSGEGFGFGALFNGTVTGNVLLAGNATVGANISGGVNLNGFRLQTGFGGTTFSGIISGNGGAAGALLVNGTTTLTGANTFTGNTEIVGQGVTLQINSDANLGNVANSVILGGGLLSFNAGFTGLNAGRNIVFGAAGGDFGVAAGDTVTITQALVGTGTLGKSGDGTLILTNAANSFGGVSARAGTLRLVAPNTISDTGQVGIGFNGTLDLNNNSETIGFINGAGQLMLGTGSLTINDGGQYQGIISGSGSVIKQGTGVLQFLGANTYSGGTVINGGELRIEDEANLGAAGTAVTINAGAGFATLGASMTTTISRPLALSGANPGLTSNGGSTLTYSGLISGGNLTIGTGPPSNPTIVLTNPGNTFGGTLFLTAGLLQIASDAPLGVSTSFQASTGGAVEFVGYDPASRPFQVTDLGGIRVSSGTTTYSGPVSGAGTFIKTGAGTLVLTNIGSNVGGLSVSGGTFQFGASNILADNAQIFLSATGTANLNGFSDTVGTVFSPAGGVIALGGGALSFSSGIGYDGVFTGNGTVNLRGVGAGNRFTGSSPSFTGQVNVEQGTLDMDGAAASAAFRVFTGATLTGGGIVGNITVDNNGILAPDPTNTTGGLGTLTAANVTWNGGADFFFGLGAANTSDRLVATTLIRGTNGAYQFDFQNTGNFSQNYLLIDTTGGISGFSASDFSYINLAGNAGGTFNITGGDLYFATSASSVAPEPGTLALATIGALSLLTFALRRRRHNKNFFL